MTLSNEQKAIIEQLIDELSEAIRDDDKYGTATPGGRPHDPSQRITEIKNEIFKALSNLQRLQSAQPEGYSLEQVKEIPQELEKQWDKLAEEKYELNPKEGADVVYINALRQDAYIEGRKEQYLGEDWIRLEDGLPDKNGYYICWCGDEPGLIHYHKDTGWMNGAYNGKVTHYKILKAPSN